VALAFEISNSRLIRNWRSIAYICWEKPGTMLFTDGYLSTDHFIQKCKIVGFKIHAYHRTLRNKCSGNNPPLIFWLGWRRGFRCLEVDVHFPKIKIAWLIDCLHILSFRGCLRKSNGNAIRVVPVFLWETFDSNARDHQLSFDDWIDMKLRTALISIERNRASGLVGIILARRA